LEQSAGDLEGGDLLPFSPLWSRLVGYARDEVFGPLASEANIFSDRAQRQLCLALLEEISSFSAPAVYTLFSDWRAKGKSFASFVETLGKEQYASLFDRFPALARCVDTSLRDWIDQTRRLIERLRRDEEVLRPMTGGLRIQTVGCALSDRHDGARGILLHFESGARLVYKPKNMSVESRLSAINDWLAKHDSRLRFGFPWMSGNAEYGWVEFVQEENCESEKEVRDYFYRAGGWLCLAFLLNATDLHDENLVAAGPNPVLVDTETFFTPEVRPFVPKGAEDLPLYRSPDSLFSSGFLTFWDRGLSYGQYDFSALTGTADQPAVSKIVRWIDANTDQMRFVYVERERAPTKNRVLLRGNQQHATNFKEELCSGFGELFSLVCREKDSFLRFVNQFRGTQSRLLFRASQVYEKILSRSLSPENLVSGLRRNISIDQLYRPPLRKGYLSPELQRILDAEIGALLETNIPRFYCRVEGGAGVPDFSPLLWESPLETVRRRIEKAAISHLPYHQEVIREALVRRPIRLELPLSNATLGQLLDEYVDSLYGRANQKGEDYCWNLPTFWKQPVSQAERLGIYNGDIGIVLLLAATDRERGNRRSGEYLDRVKRATSRVRLTEDFPLGVGYGSGSLIYGSVLLGQLSGDREWFEVAARTALAIPIETIRSHAEPDIMSGQAGLLVALSRLSEVCNESGLFSRMDACVDALTQRYDSSRGWQRPNGDASPGFAHGSAGVAFSAAVCAKISGSERARDLARLAIDFDRRLYSETRKNWPALIGEGNPWMIAWCNGFPGILLSRIAALDILDDPRISDEVAKSFEASRPAAELDFWCCGRTGIAEILIHCSQALGETAHLRTARRMIEQVLERGARTCFFRYGTSLDENYCFQPSLFRGLSGIAYSALRAMSPGKYPSIVAFDLVR
jgi:type 2 lantibiotic biosynthesis protein LanM